jgi:hypothetical protein
MLRRDVALDERGQQLEPTTIHASTRHENPPVVVRVSVW